MAIRIEAKDHLTIEENIAIYLYIENLNSKNSRLFLPLNLESGSIPSRAMKNANEKIYIFGLQMQSVLFSHTNLTFALDNVQNWLKFSSRLTITSLPLGETFTWKKIESRPEISQFLRERK